MLRSSAFNFRKELLFHWFLFYLIRTIIASHPLSAFPGNLHYFKNLRILRLAFAMQPQLFTEELFEATFVDARRKDGPKLRDNWPDWVRMMREKWENHKNVAYAEQATLLVEFNVDGVAPFKAARRSGQFTPVLGRLTGLQGESGTFTFFDTKPFVIGYWYGIGEPPSRVMNDLARELTVLHPTNRFSQSPETVAGAISLNASFSGSDISTSSPPCSPAVRAAGSRPSASVQAPIAMDCEDVDLEPIDLLVDADDEDDEGGASTYRHTFPLHRSRLYSTDDSDLDSTHDVVERGQGNELSAASEFKSIAVKVDRFACDAPATSKLTGRVGHSGYFSQPGCRQRGKKVVVGVDEKGADKYSAVVFPKLDCHTIKRYDKHFLGKYREPEADAANRVSI